MTVKYVIGVILVLLACFFAEYIADTIADRWWNSWLGTAASILFAVAAVAVILYFQYKFGIYKEW